jgi:indolepyruvate ferredoxin oxidoreductase
MGLGDGELGRIVRMRAGDLVAYQNEKYAHTYLDVVKQAAAAGEPAFAEAVARGLYKLMAYKDEYEVARLHLEEAARVEVENAVGGDVRVSWNLHPPMLRSLGMKNKIALGPWAKPMMVALRSGRKVRGTWMDPFGHAKVRKMERSLVDEYVGLVKQLAPIVGGRNLAAAVELAGLPDLVRGYEEIKMRNVERYHSELARLRSNLNIAG